MAIPSPSPKRTWANSSLLAGLLWIVLAALPVPGTTLLGLPFGVYAIFGGLFSHRERWQAGDRAGARRARWGVGLGCLGFVIAVALDLIVVGVVVAGIVAALYAASGVHAR